MRLAQLLALLIAAALMVGSCGSDEDGPYGGSSADNGGPANGTDAGSAGAGEGKTAPAAPRGAAAESCETELAEVSDLRATEVGCDAAETVAGAWMDDPGCAPPAGASRGACTVREQRCLSVATERGVSVNCAARGRSISFLASRPAGS